jgi:hypothetical protein
MTLQSISGVRVLFVGLIASLPSLVCAQQIPIAPQGTATTLSPAWRPMQGGATTVPVRTTVRSGTASPATPSPVNGSIYYNDSPMYRSGMMTSYLPQTQAITTPGVATTPVLATGRPAIVPEQMIQPMVQTSNGLVPGQAATTPIQTTSNTVTPVAPAIVPVIPSAPTAVVTNPVPPVVPVSTQPPATPQAAPASASTPASPPTEPFVDPNVFVPAGQTWVDVDISSYVNRFPPGSGAERSVQEWIMKKYSNIVGGNQVSSLVVTSERVRLYQTPAVQQQVLTLLGRFIYYTPGEFPSQVRVINTRNLSWRNKYDGALSPTGQAGARDRMWLVSASDAKKMIEELGNPSATLWEKSGAMLANPDPIAYNGQHVIVDWSPRPGQKSDPKGIGEPTEDGVLLNFSPLIETDAATIELAVSAAVRRTAVEQRNPLNGEPSGRPETVENQLNETVSITPGKVLLFSLGEVPSFDNKRGLFGKEKLAEVLVFIACQPSPSNTVKGQPVQVAAVEDIQTRVAARPSDASRATDTARDLSDSTKLASATVPAQSPSSAAATQASAATSKPTEMASRQSPTTNSFDSTLKKMRASSLWPKASKPSTPFVPHEMTSFID